MNYETLAYASDAKSQPEKVSMPHLTKAQEALPIRATRANEYYYGGSSPYELNTHVSSEAGPHMGVKSSILSHNMSVYSWLFLLIVLLVLGYFLYKYWMTKTVKYYYF